MDAYEALAAKAGLVLDGAARNAVKPIDPAAPDALERVAEAIAVPETWFFRGREPFVCLAQFAAGAPRPLRVLSAPCSTGEEPYSIAITLLEAGLRSGEFEIDAVDISMRALKTASLAGYGKPSFRHPMPDLVEKYFRRTGQRLQLREEVAKLVRFRQANLLEAFWPAAPYHVIFCCNLLIYLHPEARQRVIARLRSSLAEEGVLFSGASELALFLESGFTRFPHSRSFACRKCPAHEAIGTVPAGRVSSGGQRPARRASGQPAMGGAPRQEGPSELADARRLADRGRLAEAAAICRGLDPTAEGFYLLGLISQSSNHLAEAEEYYRKALYLDPLHAETLAHMSLLCESRGDSAAGTRFRRRAGRAAEGVRR